MHMLIECGEAGFEGYEHSLAFPSYSVFPLFSCQFPANFFSV